MAIEYQTRKTPGGQSRRCGARLTAKKGEFSMAVSTIQSTALWSVALVIRATDSLFELKCAKITGIEKNAARDATNIRAGGRTGWFGKSSIRYSWLCCIPRSGTLQETRMSTSKLQRKTSQTLSAHFGGYTIRENSRPSWCLGDNLERLELDFLIEELNVAIEVQGAQHYQYTPHFHSSYEAFKAQQQRDRAKAKQCIEFGIRLIEIDNEESLIEAIKSIYEIQKGKKKHPVTTRPLNWEARLEGIRATLNGLLSSTNIPIDTLAYEVNHTHGRLVTYIRDYGAIILNSIPDGKRDEIFIALKKLKIKVDIYVAKQKRAKRQQKQARRNARNKQRREVQDE